MVAQAGFRPRPLGRSGPIDRDAGRTLATPTILGDVIAVLGGIIAAFSWASATLCSTRSSRMIGASSVLAWVMLVGVAAALVPALLSRPTGTLEPLALVLAVVQGGCYVGGLFLAYSALRRGRVGIVAPILSTEGALAAVVAVALGEPLGVLGAVLLVVVAVGVVMAAVPGDAPASDGGVAGDGPAVGTVAAAPLDGAVPADAPASAHVPDDRTAVLLAIGAAGVFAIGLVTSALAVREGVPVAWVALIARLVGILAVAVPLVLARRLRLVRAAVPLVVAAGVLEVVGTAAYTLGAQDAIAVAAVVSGQFAAIAAIGGFLLFGERLHRVQLAGASLIVVGVAVLTAARV